MSTTTFTGQSVDLIYPGEESTAEGWYVSHWNAGQSSILKWSTDNVYINSAGAVELVLSVAPPGSERAYLGGEVQSIESATTGTWTWTTQVPELVSGSVYGLFTYRADHFNDPWIEFDMEFLGRDAGDFDADGDIDVTKVRLNIHMEYVDASGQTKKITLEEAMGRPVIVDLGFDATEGLHTYDIVVTGTEAIFLVDGAVVGRFDAQDMGGIWTTGEMKGFTNLWCVDPSLESWAGTWTYSGEPLVATVAACDVRPGDLGEFGQPQPDQPPQGTAGDDALVGTDGDDIIDGLGGNDRLEGGAGDDTLDGGAGYDHVFGGDGNDSLIMDAGDDTLDGGAGIDWLRVTGSTSATIDLAKTTAQATGYGADTVRGIENVAGGSEANKLYGDGGANVLHGNAGNDLLQGRAGTDTLMGGAGQDTLYGGTGDGVRDMFVFASATESAVGRKRDTIYDIVSGIDDIDLSGIDAREGLTGDQPFDFSGTTAQAYSVWYAAGRSDVIVRGDVNGDMTADFEIRVVGVKAMTADDFLL